MDHRIYLWLYFLTRTHSEHQIDFILHSTAVLCHKWKRLYRNEYLMWVKLSNISICLYESSEQTQQDVGLQVTAWDERRVTDKEWLKKRIFFFVFLWHSTLCFLLNVPLSFVSNVSKLPVVILAQSLCEADDLLVEFISTTHKRPLLKRNLVF